MSPDDQGQGRNAPLPGKGEDYEYHCYAPWIYLFIYFPLASPADDPIGSIE